MNDQQQPPRQDPKQKLTGLWIKQGKNGATYLSGPFTATTQLMCFKNTHKKDGSNEPDYLLYTLPRRREEAQQSSPDGFIASQPAAPVANQFPPNQQLPPSAAAPTPAPVQQQQFAQQPVQQSQPPVDHDPQLVDIPF